MSTPSLLNIPYRLKAGTLYSQIPETGLGDFAVTRSASNVATRINSLGFIERVSDNVPRLDYPLGGAVNGCPALLVEPSAVNSVLQSENFTTTWGVSNATPTANQATSPDNTLTADRISITSNGGYIRQLLATSNSLTYTLSCFVKNDAVASGDTFRLYFNNNVGGGNAAVANATININAGTVSAGSSGAGVSSVSASIENYGNGWYRVRLTFTLGASAGNASSEIGFEAPTATRTFFAWGAQLEVGSVPTSYIGPTTTAAITRGNEIMTRASATALIGQSEGSIYWDIAAVGGVLTGTGNPEFGVRNEATTNFIGLTSNGTASPFRISATATVGSLINYQANITSGKAALAWSSAGLVLYVNGVQVATSATNPNFSFTRADIRGVTMPFKANAFALYPNRLSNTELQALTA
jgi:hypothetical protein